MRVRVRVGNRSGDFCVFCFLFLFLFFFLWFEEETVLYAHTHICKMYARMTPMIFDCDDHDHAFYSLSFFFLFLSFFLSFFFSSM